MSKSTNLLHSLADHLLSSEAPPGLRVASALPEGLQPSDLVALFESQLLSRQLDLLARELQSRGDAYYTIGSAGHEGNAVLGRVFRVTDPAFLHYRDAALFIERAHQHPGTPITWQMLLSFMSAREEPIAGGRHKVLGSKPLHVPPQTSTIASHLPKAVGAAYSLGLWRRLGGQGEWPEDSVVLCSFGDASLNHSTAQGALNTAGWTAWQGIPLPLVMVCADNGLGISVPTPAGWVEASLRQRPGLHYLHCNGLDPVDTWIAAHRAEKLARHRRQPVCLHMTCVRLYGHAGSDTPQAYLTPNQIRAQEANDPLLYTLGWLRQHSDLSDADLHALIEHSRQRLQAVAEEAVHRPRLHSVPDIMASIVPPKRDRLPGHAPAPAGPTPTGVAEPTTLARLLNQCLDRHLHRQPRLIIAGEDVGRKGGVYGVTQRLQARHGRHRVIDTLLDEQSIMGLGIGLAHNGLLPIVEIQFLAYLHNAEDQLRGEASTLSFFSSGQYTNPMIVRIAGLGYQKGFGGHFHNDNALAVLRDIPGLLVACPSDGHSAVGLLQEAIRLVEEEQRVVVFLEPIARYHCRDLLAEGDGLWCHPDPGPDYRLPVGHLEQYGKGTDLAIITYGNGVYYSRQAMEELEQEGLSMRLIDLCWLTGIDHAALAERVADCRKVLIVDECRRRGSLSEELVTELLRHGVDGQRLDWLTAEDSFIPLGPGATSTMPSRESIAARARQCVHGKQEVQS